MALSLRADIFSSGKTSASFCISERAWPYPYGGHFPIRQDIRIILYFGKGMTLSLRADIFPSGKTCRMVFVFGKGMALSLRRTFSRPDGITSETIYDKETTGRAV